MSKRKGPGRPTRRSGRYTPPLAGSSIPELPPSLAVSPAQKRQHISDEDREFWADLHRAGTALHQRCNLLLGDHPITASEWVDADLLSMDGADATDEQLLAYWVAHRKAAEFGLEAPELSYVVDALRRGEDPTAVLAAEAERLRADE